MKRFFLAVTAAAVCGICLVAAPSFGQSPYGVRSPAFLNPNPVVVDSGRYLTGVCYGPWGVRHQVNTNRDQVHASAYDPNRDQVDAGSLHYVEGWCRDEWGGTYRYQGYAWTSNGVAHSDANISHYYRTSRFGTRCDNMHIVKGIEGGEAE